MRRLIIAAAVVSAAVPLAGHTRIRDGAECHASGSEATWADVGTAEEPGNADNVDRNAVCLRAGGTTLFYIGGETRPEDPDNAGFEGLCGSLTVADTTFGSGHPNEGADPSDWDFDHAHPGPDGEMGTDDDVVHHHDCN